ncbi:hypothetical protein GHT06_007060 [Daphnia sinensis]|uniref:RNA-directed DNA polymerase n=1 Tax=Daphnia sinensis TaxID=1820382 RepID=A0AAD5PL15_9CRUS|nr:hypothetical protein GHT06_007060 [Daphnia sinensis]
MNNILKSNCLITRPILSFPDFTRDFIIYTDASGYGIGAVLAQMQSPPQSADSDETNGPDLTESDGVEVVIAYTSKHLNDREAKWSTTEKEAYAIVHAIEVFRTYLYGPTVASVETRTKSEVKQKESEWVRLQHEDDYCKRIIENLMKKRSQNARNINGCKINEKGELSDKYERLVVPRIKVKEIMEENHDHMLAGHLGIAKTLARIQRQFTWPNMRTDVTTYVNSCLKGARRKSFGTSKAPLQPLPPVDRVWERIAMDVVGPIQESIKGYRYILVISDYASRFVFTFPMKNQSAQTIASIMVNKLITKYGAPEIVLTDQGTNFLSNLVKEICKLFRIKQMKTTAYHPQTDGLVERFNRTLCDMLACYVVSAIRHFCIQHVATDDVKGQPLLSVLWKRTENENDHELYFRKWKSAQKLAREHLFKAQTKQKRYYDEGTKGVKYNVGELVLLNDKKQKSIVHVNRLKLYTPRENLTSYTLMTKQKPVKTWKGWTCKQWVRTKKITGSFWIGSFDTVFSQETKLISPLECWEMINDRKCGGNIMQASPTSLSFTATPTGEGAWYATREYHVLNCLAEEITLRQETPESQIESPFGYLNATQQDGQVTKNHNTIVWGERSSNISHSQTIFKGVGFLELTQTSEIVNTSRLLDKNRQIEITFYNKPDNENKELAQPGFKVVGIPLTFLIFPPEATMKLYKLYKNTLSSCMDQTNIDSWACNEYATTKRSKRSIQQEVKFLLNQPFEEELGKRLYSISYAWDLFVWDTPN